MNFSSFFFYIRRYKKVGIIKNYIPSLAAPHFTSLTGYFENLLYQFAMKSQEKMVFIYDLLMIFNKRSGVSTGI